MARINPGVMTLVDGGSEPAAKPVTTKPDPTKTAYADLTPAQRDAMTQNEKTDYLAAARNFKMAEDAKARAATDPMKNFALRPEAPKKAGMIQYYSWIGDSNTGSWKLYSAVDTPENQQKYGARSTGGATQATAESPVGANSLVTPPVFDPKTNTWKPATTTLNPGDPGYVAPKVPKFGEPGYILRPGDPGYVAPGSSTGIPDRPIGTPLAFVYDPVTKTYKMPAKPAEAGNWTWDNNSGWTNTLVVPGSTGMEAGSEKTLALDTFKNTLALYFGAKEMSQPWANALFKTVSSYYKTGATIDEALNLSLQDARNKPELEPFTKRFAGVFALQDRRAAGEALDVPTIAEFFTSQVTLGDRLREVGLGDLATNEILGEVLGTGKSVAAALGLVNDVFMAIDNAPKALKEDLAVVAPGIDRTSIAKALLLGKRGAEELEKKISQVKVFSAAKSQGIKISDEIAADYAARGIDYGTALEGFGTVAMGSPTMQKLTEISNQTKSTSEAAQQTLMKSIFEKDVKAQEQIRLEGEKEIARFSGSSGTFGSRSLASRNRANRVI